jgi:DNA-binding response OmpR family regulator
VLHFRARPQLSGTAAVMSSEQSPRDLELCSRPSRPVWTCGPCGVEPEEGRVLRDGEPVALTPKALDLLVLLLSHRGRLVTREALFSSSSHTWSRPAECWDCSTRFPAISVRCSPCWTAP